MRAKIKRRAGMWQLIAHCDISLIQDTHADATIMKQLETETFPETGSPPIAQITKLK
jgi:hypothetical protein